MSRNVLTSVEFKNVLIELIGNYFYLFSQVYDLKGNLPTNREMQAVLRDEIDKIFGFKVILRDTQRIEFDKTFTREYNLIVKGNCA